MSRHMVRFSILYFLVLVLPATLPAEGTDERDIERIVASLQKKYENVSTLSAEFTQETFIRSLGKKEVAKGSVYFQKPGRMRWNYTAPSKDEVVSDGTTLWVYEPELAQVIETPAYRGTAAIAMDFLAGTGNLKKDFSATLIKEKAATYLIGLEPRVALEGVKKISIEVDKNRYLVVKSLIEDHFGGSTEISLEDIKLNTALKDSLFEFSVPEGVRVFRP
jgi:outer membrane lipoprotein carrier protein